MWLPSTLNWFLRRTKIVFDFSPNLYSQNDNSRLSISSRRAGAIDRHNKTTVERKKTKKKILTLLAVSFDFRVLL